MNRCSGISVQNPVFKFDHEILQFLVKELLPGGAADRSGVVCSGDEIISINGTDLAECTYEEAVIRIDNSLSKLVLGLRRTSSIMTNRRHVEEKDSSFTQPGTAENQLVRLRRDKNTAGFGFIIASSIPHASKALQQRDTLTRKEFIRKPILPMNIFVALFPKSNACKQLSGNMCEL
ncbi:hypothetical protein Ciccas_008061 [Cichlidogyrus casuarinus]|uniref:PDZ domain-containing protein n=1 Tax=Cichlidogyrus casuarinus TaxID=1844966 RepID=A0ABD2Q1T6_9PLAT